MTVHSEKSRAKGPALKKRPFRARNGWLRLRRLQLRTTCEQICRGQLTAVSCQQNHARSPRRWLIACEKSRLSASSFPLPARALGVRAPSFPQLHPSAQRRAPRALSPRPGACEKIATVSFQLPASRSCSRGQGPSFPQRPPSAQRRAPSPVRLERRVGAHTRMTAASRGRQPQILPIRRYGT